MKKGFSSAEESYRLLKAAKEMGFKLRIHLDEIASMWGVDIAAQLGAVNFKHFLMMITDEGIRKLSETKVIGNLLPEPPFSLMENTYAISGKK